MATGTTQAGSTTGSSATNGSGGNSTSSEGSSATSQSTSGATTGGSQEGPDVQVGLISIELIPVNPVTGTAAHTAFQGAVREAPDKQTIIWELAESVGDCELYTPRIPFCETACGSDAACVEDDVCEAYPARVSVGTISIKGAMLTDGGSEFSVNPIGANFNYLAGASVSLAYPPFAEGDTVELAATGGDYQPFSISTQGIAPLEVGGEDPLPMQRDEPLALTWTKAGVTTSRIDILVDISHHGGVKGKIVCDVADSGDYSIDASLVTQLMDLGVAGFPTVKLSRHSVGSARIALGRVDFETVSVVERPLAIPGLTSCNTQADCEADQTCLQDRSCG